MSVIDRVKTHFETLQTITIEVEEWKDEHGKASIFYSEPLTLEEKNTIFKKSNNFQDLTVLVDLLIMKLMVKNDKGDLVKAFQIEDKFALRKKADSNVIASVANQILVDANYEEAEKK
nr:putative phage tail assembly chaperone [uncultured Mediterranean phage uvMED]